MLPVMFRIPGLGWEVPGYGFALMVGFLLATMWAVRRAERSGGDPEVVLNAGFLALFGGVIGARFMYVAHYWEEFANRGGLVPTLLALVDVRQGGLEVYGGFIAVVVLVLFYLWRGKHSIRWYLDILAPSAALGMSIGRVGCFLNGCCWGGVCDLPWAVRFPFASPPSVQHWTRHVPGAGLPDELLVHPDSVFASGETAMPLPRESLRVTDAALARAREFAELRLQLERSADPQERQALAARLKALPTPNPRAIVMQAQMLRYGLTADQLRELARAHPSAHVHPAQLYAVVTLGLLALLLSTLYWRRTRDGQVILTLLLIEPWTRWLLETLRADNPVDVGGALTISQLLALCLSAAGLLGLLALRWLPPRSPRAALWTPPPDGAAPPKRAQPAR